MPKKKVPATEKKCRDCPPESKRPAPYKGPRCATHHRERRKATKEKSRDSYLRRTYSITEEQFEEILESQGGTCFICGPITGRNGTARKLSVDHDHSCCDGPRSCGRCVRALLCNNCNKNILGHVRDNVDALERAIQVITDPPARKVLDAIPDEQRVRPDPRRDSR
jgi:hypothetical protein